MRANNWIGDVVMISPAMKALRETYPSARIDVLVRSHVRDCFTDHPWVDGVVLHDPQGAHRGLRGLFRLAGELRRNQYDLAVLFVKAFGSALLARLAGIPRRIGYDTDRRGFLLTDPIHETAADRGIHHVDYFLKVAAAAGCDVSRIPRRVYFPVDAASDVFADGFLGAARTDRFSFLAAFAVGASKGPRAWHAERFAALAAGLASRHGAGVLVVGGPADRADARLILTAAGDAAVDATGRTTIRQMAALIKRCRVFVGNDSGPMHLASALDVPVLALFGPGSPAKTAPFMPPDRFIAMTNDFQCSPCRQDFFKECTPAPSGKPMCLETISIAQAEESLTILLKRSGVV